MLRSPRHARCVRTEFAGPPKGMKQGAECTFVATAIRASGEKVDSDPCFPMSCATAAFLAGVVAAHHGYTSLFGWVYGVGAVVVAFLAFICLTYEETVSAARRSGDRWVALINNLAPSSKPRGETSRGDAVAHAAARGVGTTTEFEKAL